MIAHPFIRSLPADDVELIAETAETILATPESAGSVWTRRRTGAFRRLRALGLLEVQVALEVARFLDALRMEIETRGGDLIALLGADGNDLAPLLADRQCQTALERDPLSACKGDPSAGW